MAKIFIAFLSLLALANAFELEQLASDIKQSFDASFAPTDKDSPFHQLLNGEHLKMGLFKRANETNEDVQVKVVFRGRLEVEATRNKKRHTVKTDIFSGAGVVVSGKQGATKDFKEPDDITEKQLQEVTSSIGKEAEKLANTTLAADELGVLVAHGGKATLKFKAGDRSAAAKLRGGYIVASKTKHEKKDL